MAIPSTMAVKRGVRAGSWRGADLTRSILRRILLYDLIPRLVMAKPKPIRRDAKAAALARDGALNPHPEAVRDPLFSDNPFFDPRDLVQVRYEMVRRHEADGQMISTVA